MPYLDLDARNGGSPSGVRCPTYGSRGGMRYHASYRRFVVEELCKLRAARCGSERCTLSIGTCCVLAAIGFDLAENLSYSIAATMAVTVVCALKSTAGHTLYGAIMGLALARAERAEKRESDATAWHMAAIAVPTALHGLYDLLLYIPPPSVAFAFVLAYGVIGTVTAAMLASRALGVRLSVR